MKVMSLKLKEPIFEEVERIVKAIHVSRNSYINDALYFFNKLNERRLLRKKLARESKAVHEVSLEVLSEFEKLDDNLDA